MSEYQETEDEFYKRKRSLFYQYEKYIDGKISYDKYMALLEHNLDVIGHDGMLEVNKWRENKAKGLAEKKQQEITRRKQKDKAIEDVMLFISLVSSLILGIIIWFGNRN